MRLLKRGRMIKKFIAICALAPCIANAAIEKEDEYPRIKTMWDMIHETKNPTRKEIWKAQLLVEIRLLKQEYQNMLKICMSPTPPVDEADLPERILHYEEGLLELKKLEMSIDR